MPGNRGSIPRISDDQILDPAFFVKRQSQCAADSTDADY
jgi:hypothetical protein